MCTRGGSVYIRGLNTRMKRKAPETERQPAGQPWEIIDVNKIEASQDSGAGSNKRSWVWNHFKEHNGEAVCQVITYLSIPATSAALEQVFSTGRRVISWQ
ncbi:hypothetical protein PGT21_028939 [Puccinia graminis f. sp. tritici]|uniref:Uncharacterized protein n=1 Tax=Puccinia graminis f. sp. tritici TaxID=56615 RepID=A0A5B0P863_PUCGR|nr:hypothetical protein PGT21_028939 [Puccinia graminis f. sp. tritici]KAA1108071.1 hypothetical protein PGTUg99_027853 [Puccinia graminis f. sp. tritici]